jgi:hypothetical protein
VKQPTHRSAPSPACSAIAANVNPRSALAACSSARPSGRARKLRGGDDMGIGDKEGFVQGYLAILDFELPILA